MTALEQYFGDNFSKVSAFNHLLVEEGDLRGLIGPRELPRLWERHILNSASVAQFIAPPAADAHQAARSSANVVDIGSGAGFPGIVLACMRPDAQFYLIDSMLRRTDWLSYAVDKIGLDNVTVIRGRAEEICQHGLVPPCDFATARAVAPLKKLLPWTMPFLKPGGSLLALKGDNVSEELDEAGKVLRKFSKQPPELLSASALSGADKTTVFKLVRK